VHIVVIVDGLQEFGYLFHLIGTKLGEVFGFEA
jgi:hypothetical protein